MVDSVEILNMDKELSNPSSNAQILSSESGLDQSHYIISDADYELLILIQFKQVISLKSIKLFASMDNIDIDQDEIDEVSLPKDVNIYKLGNLSINFDDLESLKSDKSIKCSNKKLSKGQNVKLQKDSKLALKFRSIQYLAIYIKTNQNETEKTLINNIILNGVYDETKTDEQQSLSPVMEESLNENKSTNNPQNVHKIDENPMTLTMDPIDNDDISMLTPAKDKDAELMQTEAIIPICICGGNLLKTDSRVYGEMSEGVGCDNCGVVCQGDDIVYHCPKKADEHKDGYDLCEKCAIVNYCSSGTNCKAIHRIISGLIRYQNVNKGAVSANQKQIRSSLNEYQQSLPIEKFTEYLLTKYPNYLDDISHLHQKHEYDLEKIHDLLLKNDQYQKCDINSCLITDRHCDINDGKNGNIDNYDVNNMDPLYLFNSQIWDSVHFYGAHIFELGMRERARDQNQDSKNNDDECDIDDEWNIIDHEMNRRWKRIQHKRNQTPRVYNARFKLESNKFIIQHVTESTSIPTVEPSSNIDTEIDDIIQCLVEEDKINDEQIKEFIKFIKTQKYDTESIFMDVTMNNITSSNIFAVFPTFQIVLNGHIHHRKCMLII